MEKIPINMNKLFGIVTIIALVTIVTLVTVTLDDSFACSGTCSNEKGLKISAGYDTIVYDPIWHTPLWTDHHSSNHWGSANSAIPGTDAVTLANYERYLYPSFKVKSIGYGSTTASYIVTYQIENSEGKLTHNGSQEFTGFFSSSSVILDENFPKRPSIPKYSTITYTLKVILIR